MEKRQKYETLILRNLEEFYKYICQQKFLDPSEMKQKLLKLFQKHSIHYFSKHQLQEMLQELLK